MGFEGRAEEWNRRYPIGTPVIYRLSPDSDLVRTVTTSKAWKINNAFGYPIAVVEVDLDSVSTMPVRLAILEIDEPRNSPLSSSRQDRADASIIAAAKELASLVISLSNDGVLDHVDSGNLIKAKLLAAQIQGLSGAKVNVKSSEASGAKVYLKDLVVERIYITHFPNRNVEWSYVCHEDDDPFGDPLEIRIKVNEEVETINAADYGLAPYGGVNSAWIPNVWTESTGVNVSDGKRIMRNIEPTQDGDLPENEDEDIT